VAVAWLDCRVAALAAVLVAWAWPALVVASQARWVAAAWRASTLAVSCPAWNWAVATAATAVAWLELASA
jgi:hypothetical protein